MDGRIPPQGPGGPQGPTPSASDTGPDNPIHSHKGRTVEPAPPRTHKQLPETTPAQTGRKRPAASDALPPSGSLPRRGRVDISASFPVNYESPDYSPPEAFMPQPQNSPTLQDDDWLGKTCHAPECLTFVEKALAERRQREAENKEFTFEPLMTTIENMQEFIRYIREGQQFKDELAPDEEKALAWLEEKAAILKQDKAPYKRTVQLSFALMAVSEEMTRRRIFDPLQAGDPDRFDAQCITQGPIPLDRLIQCAWGGNNKDVAPENKEFFSPDWVRPAWRCLTHLLERDDILLYPSFQPLQLDDFCSFSHLPLYPIGMITDHTLNADGKMYGPLRFALHDVGHTLELASLESGADPAMTWAESVLCTSAGRLAFRQLLRDPFASHPDSRQTALTLLLFQLFHEMSPVTAAEYLDQDYRSFLACLRALGKPRKEDRAGYHEDFQKVTDDQAAMAVLWTIRLWQCWKAAGDQLTPEQLAAHAREFAATEAPRLQEHLDFIDRHRASLRQLFASTCSRPGDDVEKNGLRTVEALADNLHRRQRMTLFSSYDPASGLCNLDNTDQVYFSALRYPGLRRRMAQVTGEDLPEDPLFRQPIPIDEPDMPLDNDGWCRLF